jgi:hypothetical protein
VVQGRIENLVVVTDPEMQDGDPTAMPAEICQRPSSAGRNVSDRSSSKVVVYIKPYVLFNF